jgi:hypothetical protein
MHEVREAHEAREEHMGRITPTRRPVYSRLAQLSFVFVGFVIFVVFVMCPLARSA